MKRILFGGATLVALSMAAPAMAADLSTPVYKAPVYKAPVIAPVVFSWTGFYIGGNLGYSWGRANTDFNETTSSTIVSQIFRTAGPNLISTTTITIPGVAATGNGRADLNGVLGGGQIGYNWQNGSWVFGLEADLQATGERGDTTICITAGCPVGGIFGSASYKLPWLATARGRIGLAVAPKWLLYATGGLAIAEVESSFSGGLGGGPIATFDSNTTRAGVVVGGGVEGALDNNWSAKLEALWVDLGGFDNAFAGVTSTTVTNALNTPLVGFNTVTTTTSTTSGSFHSHVQDLIIRVGLNYRFGGPVVAKY
jgi:outer membrane immunogenic protein